MGVPEPATAPTPIIIFASSLICFAVRYFLRICKRCFNVLGSRSSMYWLIISSTAICIPGVIAKKAVLTTGFAAVATATADVNAGTPFSIMNFLFSFMSSFISSHRPAPLWSSTWSGVMDKRTPDPLVIALAIFFACSLESITSRPTPSDDKGRVIVFPFANAL